MHLNHATGLLTSIHYLASPHHNERPPETIIDLLVIHGISLPVGCFATGAVHALFCGLLDVSSHEGYAEAKGLRVSAHLYIDRGGLITQFVPFHRRAWHAGESIFAGRTDCNNFSIGIELEGTDVIPYEQVQYESLIKVVRLLQSAYPGITKDRIVGHVDIAPGRKTDPGPAFDWAYFKGKL